MKDGVPKIQQSTCFHLVHGSFLTTINSMLGFLMSTCSVQWCFVTVVHQLLRPLSYRLQIDSRMMLSSACIWYHDHFKTLTNPRNFSLSQKIRRQFAAVSPHHCSLFCRISKGRYAMISRQLMSFFLKAKREVLLFISSANEDFLERLFINDYLLSTLICLQRKCK